MSERGDRARGYLHGDVVLVLDSDSVIRYDAHNDAWWSADGSNWSVHNEFQGVGKDDVILLYRYGDFS